MISFSLFKKRKKVVIIVGPTASGKSSLGVLLAHTIGGEIISADSRQIYANLTHFSGATVGDETEGVPHYLVGTVPLGVPYNADTFSREARGLMQEIHHREKIPIIVGDSGFWVRTLLSRNKLPEVPPSPRIRAELESLTNEELLKKIEHLDPRRAQNIDRDNRRRLIRAIEIILAVGKVPRIRNLFLRDYDYYYIYLCPPKEITNERIKKNVERRFNQGLLEEAKINIHTLSFSEAQELGRAYKHTYLYLQKPHDQQHEAELQALFIKEEVLHAKKQRTYLKKLFSDVSYTKIQIASTNQQEQFIEIKKKFKKLFR